MSSMQMNSLENDDSFVILGSSPPPSMMMQSSAVGASMSIIPEVTDTQGQEIPNGSLSPKTSLTNGAVGVQGHASPQPVSMMDKSFASKIILGQIDAKSMQSSIFQQFPSLSASQVQVDDIVKLSSMVEEHQQLKENLEKTNIAMRRQFTVLQEWQDTVKRRMSEKNDVIEKLKQDWTTTLTDNERLTKDLSEVKQKLNETVAQFEAYQISAQKEISEMTMAVSEKDAIIQNIHAENERLQLEKADFVVLHKNQPEPSINPVDFIKKSEHEAALKDMRHQLSELAAENLDFKDMKKVYMDELNCLKVNLTAAEELHRDMRDTIATLRTRDEDSRKRVDEVTAQLQGLQDENALLKVQVEVYQKDFNMEREAREKLVTEKTDILSELQLMKMRNKQLIDDAQDRLKTDVDAAGSLNSQQQPPTPTPNGATAPTSRNSSKSASPESDSQKVRYICPICNQESKTLRLLEQHLEICLKD